MALWDNIQGKWELSGGVYTDASGNGNNLTAYNSPAQADGYEGGTNTATDFERSSSQYLAITDANQTGLDIIGNITLSAWIKPESVGGGLYHVIMTKFQTTSEGWYELTLEPDATIKFRTASSDATPIVTPVFSGTTITVNKWYHIVAVYDGVDQRIYINGELACTPVTNTNDIENNFGDFVIGAFDDGTSHYFDGVIDDVCVWSRALSATEVKELYALKEGFLTANSIRGYVRDSNGVIVNCGLYPVTLLVHTTDGVFVKEQTVQSTDGTYTIDNLDVSTEYIISTLMNGTYTPRSEIDPSGSAFITSS